MSDTREDLMQTEPPVCVTMERECYHLIKRRGEKEHYEPKWVWECDLGCVVQEDCPYFKGEEKDD